MKESKNKKKGKDKTEIHLRTLCVHHWQRKPYELEASFVLFKSPEISTNISFPTCLNTENLMKMKWEQNKMPIPMCFTFVLTIAALTAAHYSP